MMNDDAREAGLRKVFAAAAACMPPGAADQKTVTFLLRRLDEARAERDRYRDEAEAPVPMLLFCPTCGVQHVDAPEPERDWANPPHKSHLCHGCGLVWRPCDRPTNGVAVIETRGSADTWNGTLPAHEALTLAADLGRLRAALEKIRDAVKPWVMATDGPNSWNRIVLDTANDALTPAPSPLADAVRLVVEKATFTKAITIMDGNLIGDWTGVPTAEYEALIDALATLTPWLGATTPQP